MQTLMGVSVCAFSLHFPSSSLQKKKKENSTTLKKKINKYCFYRFDLYVCFTKSSFLA